MALPLAPGLPFAAPAGPSAIQLPRIAQGTPSWFGSERAEEAAPHEHATRAQATVATRPSRSFGCCASCSCSSSGRHFVGSQVFRFTDFIDAWSSAFAHINTEAVAALAGGSVGVMGTLVAVENVKKQNFEDSLCLYCGGFGELGCGMCAGSGCEACSQTGRVDCFNCHGTGHAFLQDSPSPRAGGLLGSDFDAPYS